MRLGGRVLFRKLIRDLRSRKVSIAVIALIVAIGTGALITMSSVYRDLNGAKERFYREYRLADFSIDLKRAPEAAVRIVERTSGVESARGRVSLPALLDLPNESEPITGFVISLPGERQPIINDVLLKSGSWFSDLEAPEVILNSAFATANGLGPGDRIKILLLDEQHEVLVVGTAMSPEFVYLIPTDGGIAPDPARFGVVYMPEQFLQRSGDLDGAYNQIVGKAYDASPAALSRTLQVLEGELDAWGVTNSTPRQEMPSVQFLNSELQGIRASTRITPAIFLGVAMLILNVLMNRMVAQQRTIIGTLKALGRSTLAVARHYLAFGALVALLGALGGVGLGWWMQGVMIRLYATFYNLPDLAPHRYPDLIVFGMVVSVTAASLGTIFAARRAALLDPAEAMRPPPPEKGGRILIENIGFIWSRLSFRWRLVMRAIFRNPFRSSVNLFTTMLATALLVQTFSMWDSMHYLMDYQFSKLSKQDLTVTLREPEDSRGPSELLAMPSVSSVEPQLSVVCDLEHGPYNRRIAVTGLPKNNVLFTPLDAAGEPIVPPSVGLVLTDKVARLLHAKEGDVIQMRPLIGERRRVEAPIVDIVQSYLGLSAYADIEYLSGLIGEEWVANTLLATSFGEGGWEAMYHDLKERPTVVGLSRRERAFEQMEATFGKTQGTVIWVLIMLAGLIAFGSVLNTALVSLSERIREVGTLRVLGYSAGEVAGILRGEQIILSCAGVAIGLVAGTGLSHAMALAYDTDLFRFPSIVRSIRYIHAVGLMTVFVGLAQLTIYGYIRRVNWLDALKIKE